MSGNVQTDPHLMQVIKVKNVNHILLDRDSGQIDQVFFKCRVKGIIFIQHQVFISKENPFVNID